MTHKALDEIKINGYFRFYHIKRKLFDILAVAFAKAASSDGVGSGRGWRGGTARYGERRTGGDDGRPYDQPARGRAPLVVKSVGRRLWWFVVSEEKPDGYFDVAQLHEAAGGLLFINSVGNTSVLTGRYCKIAACASVAPG